MESDFIEKCKNSELGYKIPDHVIEGLARYIFRKIIPGSFLDAVLRNDLRAACENADEINRNLLFNYLWLLCNFAPCDCWGSNERVDRWLGRTQESFD